MKPILCEVCGAPTSRRDRCTNGRCSTCHGRYCTPGGNTTPGHGRRWPAKQEAREEARKS